MLWQCLESQRRRGHIQQLGDSHNSDTWRVRHELVVKRNDDSSSCLVSPPLADTVSPVQCPSFLLAIFRGRKQDISIAICISLLYFASCIPHTIPVFVGWYLRAYQLLPPKTHIVAPKRDLCLPFNISGFVGWCIICLTIWNIQNQSCTVAYHNFHNQKVTFWKTVPSGKHTKKHWKWPIEFVDLPINSMVMFHRYVSLPEGIPSSQQTFSMVFADQFFTDFFFRAEMPVLQFCRFFPPLLLACKGRKPVCNQFPRSTYHNLKNCPLIC